MVIPSQQNDPGDSANDLAGLDIARSGHDPAGLEKIRSTIPFKLQLYSVLLALAFWIIESAMHTWLFRGWGAYLDNVIPPDANELWMRFIVVGLIIGNGTVSAALTRKLIGRERQNERLRRELQGALLRHVSGIVSICMHCKSVRNPSEQWDSIEKYLASRTKLKFSHGICTHCFEKYYSE